MQRASEKRQLDALLIAQGMLCFLYAPFRAALTILLPKVDSKYRLAEPPGTRQTIAGMVTWLLKLKGTLEPHRENSVINDAELSRCYSITARRSSSAAGRSAQKLPRKELTWMPIVARRCLSTIVSVLSEGCLCVAVTTQTASLTLLFG